MCILRGAMEISTARKLAIVSTAIKVALVVLAGFVGTLLLGALLIGIGGCTQRDFLYGLQRHLLWPVGIHLDDARWTQVNDFLGFFCEGPGILLALLLGVLTSLYLARRWLRRSYGKTIQGYRPTGYPTCPECWYNMTRNSSGICPECGVNVKEISQMRH
jgi:hypothetical protein